MAPKESNVPSGEGAESKAFANARRRAEDALRDAEKTARLVAQARLKLGESQDRLEDAVEELGALIRLIQAYGKGEYRDIPWTTVVAAAAAVIYFVMPADLIPDPLPGLGYTDDVAVLLFVMAAVRSDIDAFEVWEEKHGRGPGSD